MDLHPRHPAQARPIHHGLRIAPHRDAVGRKPCALGALGLDEAHVADLVVAEEDVILGVVQVAAHPVEAPRHVVAVVHRRAGGLHPYVAEPSRQIEEAGRIRDERAVPERAGGSGARPERGQLCPREQPELEETTTVHPANV